jgi:anaphase-promoting complex subunit 10
MDDDTQAAEAVDAEEASEVEGDDTADDDDQGGGADGEEGNAAGSDSVLPIQAVPNLDSLYGLREIGREALCWQLSSAKLGNGIMQVRDQSTDTYWQSDGVSQPHLIQVHFARRVAISHVCLYLDYNLDESYTPKHVAVQVGMTTQDLVPAIFAATMVELSEPVGWVIIPLSSPPDPLDEASEDLSEGGGPHPAPRRLVRTHLVQIEICSMHQNGRDTHVRQVQLYGPRTAGRTTHNMSHAVGSPPHGGRTSPASPADRLKGRNGDDEFTTVALSQFSFVR